MAVELLALVSALAFVAVGATVGVRLLWLTGLARYVRESAPLSEANGGF